MSVAVCVEEFLAYRAAEAESVPDEALCLNVVVCVDDVVAGCAEVEERYFARHLRAIYANGKVFL